MQGRWSLTEPLFRASVDPAARRRRAVAELMLERYGILTREQVRAEGVPGGFTAIYPELSQLETLGIARRGYFVEGLGGAQFALPGAVERLRAAERRRRSGRAGGGRSRPALWCGAGLAGALAARGRCPQADESGRGATWCWPAVSRSSTSSAAAGRSRRWSARTMPAIEPALHALIDYVRAGRIKRVALEKVDGVPAIDSPLGPALVALGFQQGPRGRLTA